MKKKIMTAVICGTMALILSGCSIVDSMFVMQKLKGLRESEKGLPHVESGTANTYEPLDGGEFDSYLTEEYAMEEYEPIMAMEYDYDEPAWNTEEYRDYGENGFLVTALNPLSTFGADVNTASYSNLRRILLDTYDLEGRSGMLSSVVKIEEMINSFSYDYPKAQGNDPFSVTARIAPCPWNDQTKLLLVGLKAKEVEETQSRPDSNLVFLIDVSGSMEGSDRIDLIKRAFRMLVENLDDDDRVSVVTYCDHDEIVLDGVRGSEKDRIMLAIDGLWASGGTNGSDGINRAYELAEKHFIKGGNNRILLATDGDLNIGLTDEASLASLAREKALSGVYLSCLGVGSGNYSDTNMEALSMNGNGSYHYLDSISEARKVLVEEAGSTLFTVAKDTKIQVDFNPAKVKGYRLIGYEKRVMAAENFADDTKDGGEIGSGHTVTALYEIVPSDSDFELPAAESKYTAGTDGPVGSQPYSDEWATVHIRYKEPEGSDQSILMDTIVDDACVEEEMDENMSWAAGVAQFGMLLQGSEYAGTTDLTEVRNRLRPLAAGDDYKEEFIYLMGRFS